MIKEKMKHNEEILVAGGFLALYVGGGADGQNTICSV